MAAYRLVYDSRHLQADCKNQDHLRNPTLCNRVWAIFTFLDCLPIMPPLSITGLTARIKRMGRQIVPSSMLPLVSGINSRLPSVNHALISPILPHPVV